MTGATGPSGASGNTGTTTTTTTLPPVTDAYYLISSNGAIDAFGGAVTFGSKAGAKLPAKIVGGAATVDGGGYWLVTAKGNVYNFGDAVYYGSPVHQHLTGSVVAFATTSDGEGYWLVTSKGAVYNYGDAVFCGSAVHVRLKHPVASFSPSFDGQGYYLATSTGIVYPYGDAAVAYPPAHQHPRHEITGIAADPDGTGYWMVAASGGVYNEDGAPFEGSAVHLRRRSPFVSIAAAPSGTGYYLLESDGGIDNYGVAPFYGSDIHHRPKAPATVVAIVRAYVEPAATVPTIPHDVFGYDISNYQCAKSNSTTLGKGLPTSSPFTVIEAAGWLDSAQNSCLAAEAAWATAATGANATPYDLYLFMNSPGTTTAATAQAADGPKGNCSTMSGSTQQICVAYNYGYNGAKTAYTLATKAGVASVNWWLDIENSHLSPNAYSNFSASEYWSYSTTLNDETIQGAIDALRQVGVDVGLYSTSIQYPEIAGNYVPVGERVPLWIAGAPWTSPPFTESGLDSPTVLAKWCAGTASYVGTPGTVTFAGGVPWILQETPGIESSPYGLDPDYTC